MSPKWSKCKLYLFNGGNIGQKIFLENPSGRCTHVCTSTLFTHKSMRMKKTEKFACNFHGTIQHTIYMYTQLCKDNFMIKLIQQSVLFLVFAFWLGRVCRTFLFGLLLLLLSVKSFLLCQACQDPHRLRYLSRFRGRSWTGCGPRIMSFPFRTLAFEISDFHKIIHHSHSLFLLFSVQFSQTVVAPLVHENFTLILCSGFEMEWEVFESRAWCFVEQVDLCSTRIVDEEVVSESLKTRKNLRGPTCWKCPLRGAFWWVSTNRFPHFKLNSFWSQVHLGILRCKISKINQSLDIVFPWYRVLSYLQKAANEQVWVSVCVWMEDLKMKGSQVKP